MSTGATIVLIVVLLAVVAVAGWFGAQWLRSQRLRRRYGPEYDRLVERTGDRRVAERELAERARRHERLDLQPLSDTARTRYTEQWIEVQERFVDEPAAAVDEADELVRTVLRERGYPTDGFDQQADDLSVEHGAVVGHYRDGHAIRTRHEQAAVSTEELRKALVHYRTVFGALVGSNLDGHRAERRTTGTIGR